MNKDIVGSMGDVSVGLLDYDNDKCDTDLKLPSPVREQYTPITSGEDVVSQLRSALNVALQVKNAEEESNIDPHLGANGCSDMTVTEMSEESRDSEHDKNPLNAPPSISVKCLCKSATFPVMDHNSYTSADIKGKAQAFGSESQENVSCLRTMSLPVLRKIIPAMKGSREKEGLPVRKLSVSWAPDVYDPLPSSVSHLPKKKNSQQYRNNKKHGKGKNKGKHSRGSNSNSSKKDNKKHHQEEPLMGRSFTVDPIEVADTEKKNFAMDPIPVEGSEKISSSNHKSAVELLDFDNDVDSPESNCGSSFLRKSRGTLHFPYAETT
ncbi:hypothetical protein V2J09_018918 [Rumex salicifolius]